MPALPNISPEIIKTYQAEVLKNSSSATARRKAISLKRFFDWAKRSGKIDQSPILTGNTSPGSIRLQKRKVGFKTWTIIGLSAALVVLIFLLINRLRSPVPSKSGLAQGPSQTPGTQSPTIKPNSTPIPANGAVIAGWNLYAKLTLTDQDGVPQVGSQTITFKLFNSTDSTDALFTSAPQTVTTDASGSAIILISGVPTDLFFQNKELFLEPEMASSSGTARIPVSTANIASNLSGYPAANPETGAGPETVPVINSDGALVLAGYSPAIKAREGNLLLTGQAVTIKSADGSGGNIDINPDGIGVANFLFEGSDGNFLNAEAPNLTTGSLYYGIVPNDSTGYDLLKLENGSSTVTTRFTVDAGGNTYASGNLSTAGSIITGGLSRLNSAGQLTSIYGYSQDFGNFTITQKPGDYAAITKKGSALSDVLTVTLDEAGQNDSSQSALLLNRTGGNLQGAALKVATGNAIFNGQIKLGEFSSNPVGIGPGSMVFNTGDNNVYYSTGASWVQLSTGSNSFSGSFTDLTSGINITADMVVSDGASLTYSGAGIIDASSLQGSTWNTPGAIGSGTPNSGAFTTLNAETGIYTGAAGGTQRIDDSGNLINIGTTEFNSITYTWPGSQNTSYILQTDGSGQLSWADPSVLAGGANYWDQTNGALYPKNSTVDLLIGSDSTASAKFAFIGVSSGVPTASISGTIAGVATYLDGNGNLGTTNMSPLTLGSSTTGNVVINSRGSTALTATGTDLTAGGTFTLPNSNILTGVTDYVQASGGYSVGGDTTYYFDGSGNINANAGTFADTITIPNSNTITGVAGYTNFNGGVNATSILTGTTERIDVSGNLTNINTTQFNGITYTWPGSDATLSGYVLSSDGSGNLSWINPIDSVSSIIFWTQADGVLFPKNNSVDVLIGSDSTSSAKFAFINVNDGTPTASIAGTVAGVSTYLTGDGNLGTTNMADLTIGGSTTGNVILNSEGSVALTAAGTDLTAGGTFTLPNSNILTGVADYVQASGGYSVGGDTTYYFDSSGNLNANAGTFADVITIPNSNTITGVADYTQFNAGISVGGDVTHYFDTLGNLNALTISTEGNPRIDDSGNLTNIGSTEFNGVTYTWPGSDATLSGYVLSSDGSGNLSWINPIDSVSSIIFWTQADGALFPKNNSVDVLIGSDSTASAKFAFINVNDGTPTASIAGTVAGVSTYLTGDGNLGTTNMADLTIGGSTTGNVILNSEGSVALTASGTDLTTGGTFTLPNSNTLTGVTDGLTSYVQASGGYSVGGDTTYYFDSSGNLNANAGTFADTITIPNSNTITGVADYTQFNAGISVGGDVTHYFDTLGNLNALSISTEGNPRIDELGNLTNINTTQFNGITYTWPGSDADFSGYVLSSDGSGNLSWINPIDSVSSIIFWTQVDGALFPKNNSVDVLIGSDSTSSAKFAFINVNDGTPTASIAGTVAGVSTYLTGDGNLATTNMSDLTLGGSTTGNVILNSEGSVALTASGTDLTAGGTFTLPNSNILTGVADYTQFNAGISVGGDVTHYFDTLGNLNALSISTEGNPRIDELGNLTNINTTQFNGVTYTWPDSIAADNYILQTQTDGSLAWVDPAAAAASSIFWTQVDGALFPKNNSVDVLIGSDSTASAKFAFINVNDGTPTASIAGSLADVSTYLTGDGNLATTNMSDLTLGGSETGNVVSSSPFAASSTITLPNSNVLTGLTDYLQFSQGISVGNATTYYFDSSGNLNANAGTFADVITIPNSNTITGVADYTQFNAGISVGGDVTHYFDTLGNLNALTISTEGNPRIDDSGNLTNIGSTEFNGVTYTWPDSIAADNYILQTQTDGSLAWVDPAGAIASGIFWTQGSGVLYPKNSTVDVLIGSDSTASAKFAFINVNDGTPTASIAGSLADVSTYITGDGNLGTTNMSDLTLGGSTTGNVILNSEGSVALTATGTDLTAGGTFTLPNSNTLTGVTDGLTSYVQASGGYSVGGDTTYYFDGSGNINANAGTFADVITIPNSNTITGVADYTQFNAGISVGGDVTHYFDTLGNLNASTVSTEGSQRIDASGKLTNIDTTEFNGVTYTWPGSDADFSGYVLSSDGSGNLSWGDANVIVAPNIFWTQSSGALFPKNNSVDVLIGSDSTSSAKFAFINVNKGTPTASIAGSVAGVSTYLTGNGTLSTTNMSDLTLGGSTTGNVILNSEGSVALTASGTDLTTGGTFTLPNSNTLTGVTDGLTSYVQASGGYSVGGDTTYYFDSSGNLNANAGTFADVITIPNSNTITGVADYTQFNAGISVGGDVTHYFDTLGNLNGSTISTGGSQRIDASGKLTNIDTTEFNGVTYTWPDSIAADNYILQTQTDGSLAWVDPAAAVASSVFWTQGSGALYPKNSTVDVLIGSDSTASAKFAFINVNKGTPTASISGTIAGVATFIDGNGNISTTNRNNLTLGNSAAYDTTGNILLNPNGTGNVGIGTTSPTALLDVAGNASVSGTLAFRTGTGTIQTTAANPLIIGGNTTGNITLNPSNAAAGGFVAPGTTNVTDLGTSSLLFRNVYGTAFYQAGNQVCDTSGNCTTATDVWSVTNGAYIQKYTTADVLIGSDATSSAKFAFMNVNKGTPTASISGSVADVSTYLTGDGNLATTNMADLTIGGSTTGNVILNSEGSVALTATGTDLTAGGTFTLPNSNILTGVADYVQFNAGISVDGDTTYYFDGSGNINANAGTFAGDVAVNGGSLTTTQTTANLFNDTATTLNIGGVAGTLAIGAAGSTTTFGSTIVTLGGNSIVNGGSGTGGTLTLVSTTDGTKGNLQFFSSSNTISPAGNLTLAGNISLPNSNTLTGVSNYVQSANGYSVGGGTTYYFDSSGNIKAATVATGGTERIGATGNLTNIGTTQINGVTYTWPASSTANYILQTGSTGASSTLSWVDPVTVLASVIHWTQASGVLYPKNSTVDVLIGSDATSSAKFAFMNVNKGVPTASISGTTANVATFLTGEGNLGVTDMANLTLGGSTTGNVIINSRGSTALTANGANLTAGGTFSLPNSNTLTGVSDYVQSLNGYSVGGGTTFYFDKNGAINAAGITGTTVNATTAVNTGAGAGTGRIDATGNLTNIGTTQLNTVVYTWPGSQGATNSVLTDNGSGTLSWNSPSGGSGIIGYWQRTLGSLAPTNITDSLNLGATATSSALVHLAGTAAENSFINTGNVGVGTTNPSDSKLQVVSTNDTHETVPFAIQNAAVGSGTAVRMIMAATSNISSNTNGRVDFLATRQSDDSMDLNLLLSPGSLGAPASALYLDGSGGSVGIGTTSPTGKLNVISKTEQLRLGYDASNYNSFTVGSTGSLTLAATGTNPNITLTPGGTGYTILNGSVGVGTTSPGQKLTVEGTLGILEGGATPAYHTIFQGGDQIADVTYTLPTAQAGGTGYVLINTSGTLSWVSQGGISSKWNSLASPDGNQTLTMGAYTTTWNWDSLTTGTGLTASSTSLSSGTLASLSVTGTAAASNTQKVLSLSTSGANAGDAQTTYGLYATNTRTTSASTNTNVAGYFSASGGTNNYGLLVANGNVGIGTTSPTAGKLQVAGGNIIVDSTYGLDTATAGTLALGDTTAITINIGTSALARTITLGNVTGATAVNVNTGTAGTTYTTTNGIFTLNTGTGNISLGTDAAAKTITLGNVTGATGITMNVGTGNFTLNGVAGSTYTLGAATTTGTITIGGTAETGNMTLGSSSGTNNLYIANGAGATTLNLANVQTAGAVNIGAGMTTGTITIGGTGLQTGTITFGGGTGAQIVNLGTGGTGVKTVHIADGGAANVITLGGGAGTLAIDTGIWDITAAGVASGLTGITSSGTINFSGLTASLGVYTDGSKNLTSTVPTSGQLGYWTRTGTNLYNTNQGDNVGIGTTGPAQQLTIVGDTGLSLRPSANTANSIIGAVSFGPSGSSGYMGTTAARIEGWYQGTNWYSGTQLRFFTNPGPDITSNTTQQRMVIDKDGNVGIGTTNPGMKLVVSANDATAYAISSGGGTRVDIQNVNATNNSFATLDFDSGARTLSRVMSIFKDTSAGTGDLAFVTRNAGTFVEGMRIQSDGNVGIGTTNPIYLLDLLGVGTPVVRLKSTTSTNGAEYYLENTGNSVALGIESSAGGSILSGTSAYSAVFGTGYNYPIHFSTNNVVRMTIASTNGNVGIGTTNPQGTLEVRSTTDQNLAIGGKWHLANGMAMGSINDANTANEGLELDASYFYLYGGYVSMPGGHGADIAENYQITGTAPRGGLVSTDNAAAKTATASGPTQPALLGVITTTPGAVMDADGGFHIGYDTKPTYTNEKAPIALVGSAPTLVTSQNGQINIGDAVSISDIPGFGAKMTTAGQIVGKALEKLDTTSCSAASSVDAIVWPDDDGKNTLKPCFQLPDGTYVGKIMVAVAPSWYDPGVYLTDTGDLNIASDSGSYKLTNTADNSVIDRIGAFAQLVAANIKAGAITAITATFNSLISPITQTALISPIPGGTDVTVRIGSEATPSGKFAVQNAQGQEVASVDSAGNATFSGQLAAAGATVSGELYADNIHSLTIDQIQEQLKQVKTDQDLLTQAASWNTNTATNSAQLDQLVLSDLYVTSHAAVSSLLVNDDLTAGKINSLSGPLQLQSLAAAPIELMAGLVTIDTNGNVMITGDLAVGGSLNVGKDLSVSGNTTSSGLTLKPALSGLTGSDLVNPDATDSAKLLSLQDNQGQLVASVNASGSAQFGSVSTPQLVIAGPDATVSGTIVNGVITTNSTIGQAVVPAGVKDITIRNPKVTDYTLVYVTPTSITNNYVLYVKSKSAGQFVIGFDQALPIDVNFNWWIVQVSQ